MSDITGGNGEAREPNTTSNPPVPPQNDPPARVTPSDTTVSAITTGDPNAEEVHETSRLAVSENDENSVRFDDEGYVGVSDEYRNAAYDKNAPSRSEDDDLAADEQRAKEDEVLTAEAGKNIGFRGYAPDTPHPSERRGPAEDYIEGNRAVARAMAKSAQRELEQDETDEDE